MSELIPVLTKEQIEEKIIETAGRISEDYKGSDLVLIGVLKGSFMFLSDLAKQISIPVKIDFIGASSYGSDTKSSGTVKITKEVSMDIKDKDILIVEDIVDSGITLAYLVEHFKSYGAKSVKVCTLLNKHERRETNIKIDYFCHEINEGFLVGYGLDYNEEYRNLPEIYHLKL